MKKYVLPLRFKLLDYISTVKSANIHSAKEALYPIYGREKQFNEKNLTEHFLALKENGYINELSYDFDQDNKLLINYAINDFGKEILKKYK